jgi:hypothetical protein
MNSTGGKLHPKQLLKFCLQVYLFLGGLQVKASPCPIAGKNSIRRKGFFVEDRLDESLVAAARANPARRSKPSFFRNYSLALPEVETSLGLRFFMGEFSRHMPSGIR